MLGTQTKTNFKRTFSDWYNKEHEEYAIDETSIGRIAKIHRGPARR